MRAASVLEREESTATRYQALIRISNSIRARKQPQELFDILVHELGRAVPFDAIAQFDGSAKKLRWHLGPKCQCPNYSPSEEGENVASYVNRTQEAITLGTPEAERRFPEFSRRMG